jgi:chaperonin GroEL
MNNEITRNEQFFGDEAREFLLQGIELVYKSVSPTLGAGGRNVVYNKYSGVPIITNDGVSIARQIKPKNNAHYQGAELIKQVCEQANTEVGDGTTTSTILAYELIVNGIKALQEDKKLNPMTLRRQMLDAMKKVVAQVTALSKPIETLEELQQIATVSVEDKEIGALIGKAIFDAGTNGVVYVSDSSDAGVSVEQITGFQFQEGVVSNYFILNQGRGETVLNNPLIIVTDILATDEDKNLITVLNYAAEKMRSVVLICNEFHPKLAAFMVQNLQKRTLLSVMVKMPMHKNFIEDVCAITGATPVSDSVGSRTFTVEKCGTANKVVVTPMTTTIFDGMGQDKTAELVSSLEEKLTTDLDEKTKSETEERIARLTGKVFIVHVGGATEANDRYLRMKVDDAVSSTKAAREMGILAGGGTVLRTIGKQTPTTKGEEVVYKAIQAPFKKIVENAGGDIDVVESQMTDDNKGFDAVSCTVIENLIDNGIIDPTKVTKTAVEASVTFASLFLTTETIIVPLDTDPK